MYQRKILLHHNLDFFFYFRLSGWGPFGGGLLTTSREQNKQFKDSGNGADIADDINDAKAGTWLAFISNSGARTRLSLDEEWSSFFNF